MLNIFHEVLNSLHLCLEQVSVLLVVPTRFLLQPKTMESGDIVIGGGDGGNVY